MKSRRLKRLLDLLLSLVLVVFMMPLMVIVAVLILVTMGFPILFIQTRPGLNGQPFQMFKFRTMTSCCDVSGDLLSDAERLTKFGRFLRSTSLDELPELFNVILGNMSIVGPRPLLMEYIPLYTGEQARRHEMRPGITGLAQVRGRNDLSWEEKFCLDIYYIDNWNVLLDIKVLLETFVRVLRMDGISQAGHVTMKRFTGEKK